MKDNLKIKKIALCYLIAVIALFTLISCTTNNNTITGFAVLDENETTTTQSNENQTSTETAAINETDKEKPAKETKEEKPEKQKGPNVPPAWKSDTEEFTLYGETIIDLNNYFYDENNDTITYTSTMPEKISVAIENNLATLAPDGNNFTTTIEFTATDGDKTTKKEVALIVPERAISISLEHNSGTPFDTDDNGYEPTTGIIDLTVEGSKFSWNANESNLCTRWEVYSAENAESTTVCYGSEKCCAFVGLGPSKDIWDEVFYSTYGQYGAGLSNIVSAQIIYVDYGIREETPYAEIYYSPWENKTANYYFASIDFENVCVETCILTGFNETSYKLIFEIDNAVLNLETLTYSIAEDITQVPIILKIEDDAGLNSGAYQLYKNNEPVAVIEEFVEPDYYNIEVVPAENVIDRLLIENANLTHPVSATIGIDNVTREIGIENVEVKKRYAINLEELEFEKATLTANASANALYKCRQWDYGNELCFGAWEKIKDLTAGQQYELALTPDDPGFIEGDLNITLLNITPVNITNITGLALIKEIPNITIAVNQNATIDLADYFSNIDEDTAFANFEQDNISIIFENGIATIVPPKGFIGTSYTYITAAKGADVAISNLFSINVINITPEINLTSNITANITPKVIFRKKDFKFDEDIGVGFEYLTKQELVNEKKWKDEYEVYEEETKKTEVELTLFREKIKEDKKLLSEAEKLTKKQYKKWQKTNDTIEAFIYDNGGDLKDINVEIEELREGRFGVKIPKQRAFKAGKYILKMDLTKDGITYSQEQDFTWGVLAINVNKSIYLPNEDSFIGIGVLDDAGKIVCNADIILEITNPLNQKTTLTTQNNDIKISPECQFLGVTLLPDYYTYYSVGGVGNYIMNLTAVTANGVRNVQDNFTVQSSVAFDVARKSATRVYPKVPYKMEFTVNANDDYSGPIIEYVPSSFAITPQSDIIVNDFGNEKRIIWIEDLKNGKTYNIGYEFDAPDISPEFYILGPLDIGAFKESRQWQIANDVTTRKFFDEFDDTTQWTIAGAGAWTVVSSLVEGTNCGAGADAGTNLSITTSVDLSDCAAGSGLAEWHDIDTQALEATDCLKYTYSSDGGTTWAALATSFCDDQNQLTYKSFTIPDASLTSTFKWRFVCQGVSSTEEVRVNNFNITCDVQDTTPPFFATNSINNSAPKINEVVGIGQNASDVSDTVSMVIFAYNQSGLMVNVSNTSIIDAKSINYTPNITVTLAKGNVIGYTFWANDTKGNKNTTDATEGFRTFTVADTTPTFTLANNNTNAKVNEVVQLSALVDDADTLSMIIASWNGTGTWINVSNITVSNTANNYTVNLSIELARGNVIGWLSYANDSGEASFTASTPNTFEVANTPPGTPTILFPTNDQKFNSIPIDMNVTFPADADVDAITINYYINGKINESTSANTTFNASDGVYLLNVSLFDGTDSSSNATTINFTLDATAPALNDVKVFPDPVKEDRKIDVFVNATDAIGISNVLLEINNTNYSLSPLASNATIVKILRPNREGATENNTAKSPQNTFDQNNATYSEIKSTPKVLSVATSGMSSYGIVNSVKIYVTHSADGKVNGSIHWAFNNSQGLQHIFASNQSRQTSNFSVTSERAWTLDDFNSTEIHAQKNTSGTLRIREVWYEINYSEFGSPDLWNLTLNLTDIGTGNQSYTLYINDTTGNSAQQTNNLTTLPKLLLINATIEDANGNALRSDIEIYDENDEIEYNRTNSTLHVTSVTKGKKNRVVISPVNSVAKKIEFTDLNISETTAKIIDIDNPPNSNFVELYAFNKSVTNYTGMTITITAKGTKLYRCSDWDFANRKCNGYWTKHKDLEYNRDYTLDDTSAYAETGLIAINTHKSIYLPNEAANISIGVLDNWGIVICDASVTLLITDPNNAVTNLSTIGGDIDVSNDCTAKNKTYVPDYFTNYTVNDVGNYTMNASAVIQRVFEPSISSNFEVSDNIAFEVARSSATRIVLYENYTMNFTIKANMDFAGNMTEVVEPGFAITPQPNLNVENFDSYTLLTFNVSFVNGSTYNIGYEYDAPDISPELFLAGPLRIGNFSEARVWQIASDQAADVNLSFPDAGAPGMNLVVQFVGTGLASGDSVGVNSSGNITIGPIVVTDANGNRVDSSGRVLSTVFYIHPNATAQDVKVTVGGQILPTPFKIISLTGANKNDGNFSGFTSGVHMIGNGRNGTRTVRGTIVLDSLIIPSGVTVNIDMSDVDTTLAGNQSFLPVTIIVDGHVNISGILNVSGISGAPNAAAEAGAKGGIGGPGGGGGGAGAADVGTGGAGGGGFTGGGGGGVDETNIEGVGGIGSGSAGGATGGSVGGYGGNSTSPKAEGGGGGVSGASTGGGGGGGTGFFFGSGGGGGTGSAGGAAGSGGGGGGRQGANAGGGGGFGTAGTTGSGNGGSAHGSAQLVPLTGGSGGGGGGSNALAGGGGGGGGGAVLIVSSQNITIMPTGQILAMGGNGGTVSGTNPGGVGGAGSGGGIVLQASNVSLEGTLDTRAGTVGTAGGGGRIRIDGLDDPVTATLIGLAGSNFTGPAIKSISDTNIAGTSNASASIIVYVQQKSGTNKTVTDLADSNGQFNIAVEWYEGTNYIAVIQNSTVNTYTVMSSAAVATYDFVVVPDTTKPRLNASLNNSVPQQGWVVNMTANVSDNIGLSFCQFIDNQSLPDGGKNFFNKTVTGTKDQCSQNYTIRLSAGNVINFTVIVNDTSTAVAGGNKNQSEYANGVIGQIIEVQAAPADNTFPIVNTSFNVTNATFNDVINFTGNVTDETELLSANITYNMSGSITKVNFSLTGLTAAQVSNATLITGCFETCIINFTMYVTDTNNNVRQNSTLLVVADVTKPVVNTTLNVTNAAVNDVVNFTGNVTDLGGLLSANWTYNLSGVLTKLNYSLSGTSAQVSNITTLTCAETCVVNFTLYVTDTSNNVKQNSTLLVVADATPPVVNTTFNNTNPLTTDVINYTGNVTDLAGLKTANITYNMSGVLTKANYTLSGTSTTVTNTTTITGCVETCVINFTLYVTDTSNNVKQNSTLLVVADVTLPVVNTSLNKSLTNIFQNDIINITANVTDAGGLSFCQFIDNQSLPNGGKNFFNKTVTGNNDQCSQNYTIALAAGNVINFTVVVNDTSTATAGGNKRMNDTIITVVASNTAPVIKLNNASGFAVDPVAGGNSIILISFNVTDEQGVGDINASKAIVNLTLGIRDVAQFRFNISDDGTREFGTCYNHTVSTTVVINCTVIMRYYDNASSNWAINISVQDLSGAVGRNDTFVFTYNSLAAFSINARGVSEEANLNFTTAFLNDQNVAAKAPLLLNNTGNNDFDQINITAAVLVGITTPSETISASSFFVNVTNNTAGNGLALSTIPQVIPGVDDTSNATLLHGPGVSGDIVPYSGVANFKTKGNQSLLSWIDLPSSGLSSQTYNNTWNLTLVDLS